MARSAARAGLRRGLILLLAVLVVHPSGGQTVPPDSGIREEAQVRLRTVRLRIEAKDPANAGTCLGVGLEDLRVAVRGEEVPGQKLIELDREKEPTLHVIVLDTSDSMYDWLDYVRETASAYVAQLRPEVDLALLATFDDSLVLVHPASGDQESLQRAIEGVRKGSFTSLVDAIYYVMRDLEARRERPVVVLITDGVDSISFHDRADVNTLAEARPEMIAFTIGLAVPFFSRGQRPASVSVNGNVHSQRDALQLAPAYREQRVTEREATDEVGTARNRSQLHIGLDVPIDEIETRVAERRTGAEHHAQAAETMRPGRAVP